MLSRSLRDNRFHSYYRLPVATPVSFMRTDFDARATGAQNADLPGVRLDTAGPAADI